MSGTTWGLVGVSFADHLTGIALGAGYSDRLARDVSMILRTTDGGDTWTKASADTLPRFQAVHLTDPDKGVAVGSRYNEALGREVGYVFCTTDGGEAWTRLDTGSPPPLRSLSFSDALNGWIVGDEGTILRTTDGGTSWTAQNSGTASPLIGVSFADVNRGMVVGGMWWDGAENPPHDQRWQHVGDEAPPRPMAASHSPASRFPCQMPGSSRAPDG